MEMNAPQFGEDAADQTPRWYTIHTYAGYENAVARNREVMGATNPEQADEGTIRKVHAESIEANSVHGSDSLENAAKEVAYFFSAIEIVG